MSRNSRSGAWLKVVILIVMIAGGYFAVRYTPVADWLSEEKLRAALYEIRGIWWAPLVLLALYAVLAPFGISMFPLTIAGAAFGPVTGTVFNTIGIVIGAATTFTVARALGRDFVLRFTGKRLRRAERLLNRQGFWPLVQVRFLPIPYPVINFAAALSAVPARRFMLASLIGLIPATFVHSYFIARLIYADGPERVAQAVLYGAVLLTLNALIGLGWVYAARQRRLRYSALLAARARRVTDRRLMSKRTDSGTDGCQ